MLVFWFICSLSSEFPWSATGLMIEWRLNLSKIGVNPFMVTWHRLYDEVVCFQVYILAIALMAISLWLLPICPYCRHNMSAWNPTKLPQFTTTSPIIQIHNSCSVINFYFKFPRPRLQRSASPTNFLNHFQFFLNSGPK